MTHGSLLMRRQEDVACSAARREWKLAKMWGNESFGTLVCATRGDWGRKVGDEFLFALETVLLEAREIG